MVRRDVCCDVSASSQKIEDVFVKDDDFLPLLPKKIIGWYSSEKVSTSSLRVRTTSPLYGYVASEPGLVVCRLFLLSGMYVLSP